MEGMTFARPRNASRIRAKRTSSRLSFHSWEMHAAKTDVVTDKITFILLSPVGNPNPSVYDFNSMTSAVASISTKTNRAIAHSTAYTTPALSHCLSIIIRRSAAASNLPFKHLLTNEGMPPWSSYHFYNCFFIIKSINS
jgi:hypothetical protein